MKLTYKTWEREHFPGGNMKNSTDAARETSGSDARCAAKDKELSLNVCLNVHLFYLAAYVKVGSTINEIKQINCKRLVQLR